jgi:hypothetical protein
MSERDEGYVLWKKDQIAAICFHTADDGYLGEEQPGGNVGLCSENKATNLASMPHINAGHSIRVEISSFSGFTSEAITSWAQKTFCSGFRVLSFGAACFHSLVSEGCQHKDIKAVDWHPNCLPEFRWINTVLNNPKASPIGTFHDLSVVKNSNRYVNGLCFLFTRRFNLAGMSEEILNAAWCSWPAVSPYFEARRW